MWSNCIISIVLSSSSFVLSSLIFILLLSPCSVLSLVVVFFSSIISFLIFFISSTSLLKCCISLDVSSMFLNVGHNPFQIFLHHLMFLCLLVVFSHSSCAYPGAWDDVQVLCVSGYLGDYVVRFWILFDLLCQQAVTLFRCGV